MSPKERRDRIVKKNRPNFRKAELLADDGSYGSDMGVLWAAYKAGSFEAPADMDQGDFAKWILMQAQGYTTLLVGDDKCKAFSSGFGPVCLAGTKRDGLLVMVEGQAFKWATKKNLVRCSVAFLNMMRLSGKTGVLMAKAQAGGKKLMDHMNKYGLMYWIGKCDTDAHLYSLRCRGSE